MALSQEEELELQSIDDQLIQAQSEVAPKEPEAITSGLTPEEEAELASIDEQIARIEAPTELESAARGAVQGATFGFADEISGGVESAFTDKTYEEGVQESRAAFAKAQEANPNSYIIGEVAGGVGSILASGGAAAGLRGAAVVGGLSGIGFSNRKGSELATDAVIGAALGIAGEKTAKGIGKFIGKFFQKSLPVTQKVFKELGETTRPENVKFEASLIKDAFAGRLGSADDWVASSAFGAKAQAGLDDAPKLMRNIFKDKFKQLGGQIESIVDDLPTKSVDISDTVEGFKVALKDTLKKSGPDKGAFKTITREILDGLDDGTFGVRLSETGKGLDITDMTPSQVIEFKRSIQEIVFAKTDSEGVTNLIKESKRATTLLSDFANEITERANALDPSGQLKLVNQQYSLLSKANQLIPDKNQSHIMLKLQDAIGPNKQSGDMRTLNQLIEGVDPEFRAMVINEINPRLSAFKLHQAAQFQGGTVSEMFRVRAASGLGTQAAGPVGGVGASILALGDAAAVNTANILAKTRKAFKVPRDIAGVFKNSDMIVSKLSQVSPALAITLSDLVSDGNENAVESFMKEIMKNPQAAGQFEDGMGFNGKAVTPQEFQQVRSGIMSSSIPLSEKINSVNQLEADGTIPLPEELAPRVSGPSLESVERKVNINNMDKVKRLEKALE